MPGAKARLRLDGADPINRGLVGFWPLQEGAGTRIANLARPGLLGSLSGSPARAVSRFGKAVRFDTSATQFANTGFSVGAPSAGTVSWWQNPTYAFNASNLLRVPWGNIGTGAYLSCQLFSDNNWYVGWVNSTDYRVVVAGSAANWPQQWTFYAFTWGPSGSALYINNGTLVASNVTAPVVGASSATLALARLGPAYGFTSHFAGDLSAFRLHTRALRLPEIQRLYRDPWAGTARRNVPVLYRPPVVYSIDPEPVAYQYTPADVALTYTPGTVQIDTHDGLKRSRRLRRLEALRQRAEAEKLADAQALRLALESALGLAAEVAPAVAPRVAEAVERAPKPAEVDWRRVAEDAEQYARLSRAVAKLSALVQAEARRLADEDDDDAAFLLGIA